MPLASADLGLLRPNMLHSAVQLRSKAIGVRAAVVLAAHCGSSERERDPWQAAGCVEHPIFDARGASPRRRYKQIKKISPSVFEPGVFPLGQ